MLYKYEVRLNIIILFSDFARGGSDRKDDPVQLAPEMKHSRLSDHCTSIMTRDTDRERVVFDENELCLPDTPVRRTTFVKDDSDLPATPVRRETFLKHDSIFRNPTESRPLTVTDLEMAMRRLPSSPCDSAINISVTPGSLRRSLTYTKLNETDDYLTEDDQIRRSSDEQVKEPEDVASISPASSQYFTPLTTPLDTPHGSDSEEDDGLYEDSVMYLPGEEPLTPDPGHVTVIEADMHGSWHEETPTNVNSSRPSWRLVNSCDGVSEQRNLDTQNTSTEKIITASEWRTSHTSVTVSESVTEQMYKYDIKQTYGLSSLRNRTLDDEVLSHQIREARGSAWLEDHCGSVINPSGPITSLDHRITDVQVKDSQDKWLADDSQNAANVAFQPRLSSTPFSVPCRIKHNQNNVQSSSETLVKTPNPIICERINRDTVIKSKSAIGTKSSPKAATDLKQSDPTIPGKINSQDNKSSERRQYRCQLFAMKPNAPVLSSERLISEEPVLSMGHHQQMTFAEDHSEIKHQGPHCSQHGKQHDTVRSIIGDQVGQSPDKLHAPHYGVPMILRESPSTKKRPLSSDRQTALDHLSAPTESSKKRAKCVQGVSNKPTQAPPNKNKTTVNINNNKPTRTQQLRRQGEHLFDLYLFDKCLFLCNLKCDAHSIYYRCLQQISYSIIIHYVILYFTCYCKYRVHLSSYFLQLSIIFPKKIANKQLQMERTTEITSSCNAIHITKF